MHVLAGMPCYPDGVIPAEYRGRAVVRETFRGVTVTRVAVLALPNSGALQRFAHQASWFASTLTGGLLLVPEADVVVGSSPHLFGAATAALLARRRGVPFVLELRDLWPRIIWQTGAVPRNHPAIKAFEWLEKWLYAQADELVVVTKEFRREVAETAEDRTAESIHLIPNGVNSSRFEESIDIRSARERLGLPSDRPIALYAGVHGIAQGLEVIVDAARLAPDVHWVMLGKGTKKADLERRGAGVPNLSFHDAVGPEEMPEIYGLADVLLVPLRDVPSLRSTIPSKIFEIWAAGRPFVLSAAGEVAALALESNGAVVVPPEDPAALAVAVDELASDPERCRQLGESGRTFVRARFERKALAARYLTLLRQASQSE